VTQIKFGTDGWRGIIADDFTFENVRLVTQAICDYLKTSQQSTVNSQQSRPTSGSQLKLVVGYDTRFLSQEFAKACTEILVANDISVYFHEEPRPTPMVAFAIKAYQAAGAIMFTASHNPAQYNGIKFIPDYAGPATTKITSQIEGNIKKIKTANAKRRPRTSPVSQGKTTENILKSPLVELIDPSEQYLDHLKSLLNFDILQRQKLKVILDPLYGAGQGVMDALFQAAGCQTESIHAKKDALFGSMSPDPSYENLKQLAQEVLKKKADLGLALDGDGDRFGVVDSNGSYVFPNQALALAAVHLLKTKKLKGAIVRSVATTHLLDKIASEYGVDLIETPVGFKHVGEMMRKKTVVLGGEESAGLSILGHIPEKDGILADLLLAEMSAYEKKPLSLLLEEIYKQYGYHVTSRMDVNCSDPKKTQFFESLKNNPPAFVGDLRVEKLDDKDGIKLYLSHQNWVLFRASGTEPLVRIYVEASSKEYLQELKNYSLKLFKLEDQFEVVR